MNGNFYQNPTFPSNNSMTPTVLESPPGNISSSSILTMEQSFIENILRREFISFEREKMRKPL